MTIQVVKALKINVNSVLVIIARKIIPFLIFILHAVKTIIMKIEQKFILKTISVNCLIKKDFCL